MTSAVWILIVSSSNKLAERIIPSEKSSLIKASSAENLIAFPS